MKRTPEQRRVLARLRLVRMRLRRKGKLSLRGYTAPIYSDVSVQRLWREHGWLPRTEALAQAERRAQESTVTLIDTIRQLKRK